MQSAGQIIGYGFSEDEIRTIREMLDQAGCEYELHSPGQVVGDRPGISLVRYRDETSANENREALRLEGLANWPAILVVDRFEERLVLDGLAQGYERVVSWDGLPRGVMDLLEKLEARFLSQSVSGAILDNIAWFPEVSEGTDNIIFVFDTNWTILYANPAAAMVFELDRPQIIGQQVPQAYLAASFPDFFENMRQVTAGRKKIRYISHWIAASEEKWLDVSLIPLPLPGLAQINIMVIARDVTDLKLAELNLREAKELFQRLMQVSPVVIYSSTFHYPNIIQYMSENVRERTGFSAEEFIGHPGFWMTKVHPDDRKKVLAGLDLLNSAGACQLDYRMKFIDGLYHYIHDVIEVVLDEPGNPIGATGYFLEVTEQIRAAEEIMRSEKRYRSLAEASHDIIFLISPDSRLEYLNSFARNALGFSEQEVDQYKPGKIAELIRNDLIQQVVRTGKPLYVEYKADLDLKSVWLGTWLVPVRDPAGRIESIMGIARDITDRRRIEENLQRALSAEREVNDLRYRLLTMTTHEFKTPLSTILSSAELLENYSDHWSREKQVEHIRRIAKAATRIVQMLDQILEVNQQYYSRHSLLLEEYDIAGLCKEVIRDIRSIDREKHDIRLMIAGNAGIIRIDRNSVQSILDNLLSNAVKYSPAGTDVLVELKTTADQIKFVVRDRGIGISEADKKNLYEPFFRSKAVAQVPGNGLGLTIVKKSVELLNGTIEFRSREGGGTDFIVCLPLPPSIDE